MSEDSPSNRFYAEMPRILCILGLILFIAVSSRYYVDKNPVNVEKAVQETSCEESISPSGSSLMEEISYKENIEQDPISACVEEREDMFYPLIEEAAERYDVDPALVKAIIMAESNYNPHAVSKKGAQGLMQLMPSTAKALGVEDSFDPKHNINAGVRYFKQLMNKLNGDAELALAAYNAGLRRVYQYQGIPPFKSTQYYIKKVLKYHQYYKQQLVAVGTEQA